MSTQTAAAADDIVNAAGEPATTRDFTNNQWYCHQARQTVFLAAFFDKAPDRAHLRNIARGILARAPQLLTGIAAPLGDALLDQLIEMIECDDLDAYPDAFPVEASEIFTLNGLPPLKIVAAIRRDGPDDKGRAAAIAFISTHALMEGADSALLSRSKRADHALIGPNPVAKNPVKNVFYTLAAIAAAPLQLLVAQIIVPRTADHGYRALTLPRAQIRRVANRLGVRQRSLLFALVTHALNDHGRGFSRKKISAIYSDLEGTHIASTNDDFFRFRMVEARFPVIEDIAAFARAIDAEITRCEQKDIAGTQAFLNALFGVHRKLMRLLPVLYKGRIFRFTAGYHIDLSIAPPHRPQGELTEGMLEPVYCGTHHPGLDAVIFVPGRRQVTLNFNLRARHMPQVDRVRELIEALDNGPDPSLSAG